LFKNTNVRVSFRTANTLKQLLTTMHNVKKYEKVVCIDWIAKLVCQNMWDKPVDLIK
jgi:hypothetical protein